MEAVASVERLNSAVTHAAAAQPGTRVLIVGTGARAARLATLLATNGITIVGAIDDEPQEALSRLAPDVPWLGPVCALEEETVARHAAEIYVALPLRSGFDVWVEVVRVARRLGVPAVFEFDVLADVHRFELRCAAGAATMLHYNLHPSRRGLRRIAKRCIDIVGAAALLAVLSPLLICAAIAIKLTSRGPVLFRQERLGLARERFQMLKFRTMVSDAEQRRAESATMDPRGIMFKLAHDPRITRLGGWLRRTSIDELPQLINVLIGDMSLTGPRPIPTWVYGAVRDAEFNRRFAVLPGITGLWQIEGREQHFERMSGLDLRYVDDWSLSRDLRILVKTPAVVLRGTGAR